MFSGGNINVWDNNNWGNSNFKAVVFSRPECFETLTKMRRFFRYTKSGCNEKLFAKELFIQPYTDEHIRKFIHQFINLLCKTSKVCAKNDYEGNMFAMTKLVTHGTKWETKKSPYYKWLGQNDVSPLPHLKQLARNPLLLTLMMLILPGVAKRVENNENRMLGICATETGLYEEFLSQWFSFQCKKIEQSQKREEFSIILDYLPNLYKMYAQNLATFVLEKNRGYLTENYELNDSDTLQPKLLEPYHDEQLRELKASNSMISFFLNNENIKLLRNGCPLHFYHKNRTGFRCRFIHVSLIEFLVSRDVFQYVRGEINYFIHREISLMNFNNTNSDLYLSNDSIGITYQPINGPNVNSKVLYLLADRAKSNREFSDLLFKIVKISSEISAITLLPRKQLEADRLHFTLLQANRNDDGKGIYIQDKIKQLSANCMTILILSGRNFSGETLRNIQIPGADLRNGIFAGADLRGANCERCKFGHSFLTNVKLQGSNLKDIVFNEDKLELDAYLYNKAYMLYCCHNLLYCSYQNKIVKCDLDSGEIIQDFVINKHPKLRYSTELIRLEFIISSNKLFVWSNAVNCVVAFDLESGEPRGSISVENGKANNSVGNSETFREMQGVYELFPYEPFESSFDSMEGNNSRQDVLRLYNIQKLKVIVITKSPRAERSNEIIMCFPSTVCRPNIESLFPIDCNFKGCAFNEAKGYFALAEESGVKIYSLFTCGLITTFIDEWPALHSVNVKFSQTGKFLGILCKPDRFLSSKFQLLQNINENVEMVNTADYFNKIGVPQTYIFSSNDDNMLATQHFSNQSYPLCIWTVVDNQLTPLHQILNYDPYPWLNELSLQYSFCRNDTAIGYCSAFLKKNEISVVGIHDSSSFNNFTVKKSEQKIASVAISNDGKYRAILSYVDMMSNDAKNLEIFENQNNFPKLLSHQTFYPTKSNSLSWSCLNCISFDQTNKYLLAIGTDLRLFFVCVETGSIIRQVTLITPVQSIEMHDHLYMHSNFELLPQSNRLIIMYSHHSLVYHIDFFGMWNFDKVNHNKKLINSVEFFNLTNKDAHIEPTPIIGVCQDFDGNWVAAYTNDEVFIWSTKNVEEFQIFHPPIKSNLHKHSHYNYLKSVKFGPKAASDCVYMILSRLNEVHVTKVSESKIEIYRIIKGDKVFEFGEIACLRNSIHFATFTTNSDSASDFCIRYIRDTNFCVPLKLWYQLDGCRLVSIIENDLVDENHILIFSWGMQSNEQIFSCIKMNYISGQWKMLWSSKPPHALQASDCNIGNCHELNSNSLKSLLKFGTKGNPFKLHSHSTKYVPLSDLFSEYISTEDRSEKKDPIILTGRDNKICITENSWTISVAIKKYTNKCSKECSAPHMFLIIEGMRHGHRFIIKAHKQYIEKIAIVSLERMDDIERFRNFASSLKANQWEITKEEGMMIIHSIQDDQQTEHLHFNLFNKNCVEWCRSKIQLVPRYKNVGQKRSLRAIYDLIIPPKYLLIAN